MGEPLRFSFHLMLGDGAVADVLLWRKWCWSVSLLVGSTAVWFVLERAGYNLLSFLSNASFYVVVILFFWAKSAALFNRPLPPLPDFEVSEEMVVKVADEMRLFVNYALSVAHDIAIGGNLRLFSQLAVALWVISLIGSLFDFLTLIYIGVLLSLSLPSFYDKYQNMIDEKLRAAYKIVEVQYHMIDEKLLSKIPLPLNKEKST